MRPGLMEVHSRFAASRRGTGRRGADPAAHRRSLGPPRRPGHVGGAAGWGDDLRFAIDTFGLSRCLFESNFPVDKACYGYVELWKAFKVRTADRGADERRDLFHDTAARGYRLSTLAP
jgi:hypothetical protein